MANELTKKAMVQAFIQLLAEKPFKKITISDITDSCGINRMTFYYHFEDIYALLDYALKLEMNKALNGNYDASNWIDGMKNIFEACLKSKYLVMNAYKFNSRGNVEAILDPIVYQLTYHVVKEEAGNHNVLEEDLVFVSDCYKHLLIGTVLDWVKEGMKEDYQKVVKKIERFLDGETEWILSKFEQVE